MTSKGGRPGDDREDIAVFHVPLSSRIKASGLIAAAFAIAVFFARTGSLIGWIFAAVLAPVLVVQLLVLVIGSSLTMSRDFVSTKNAVGRTRTYRFEHCGPFIVWANPMEAKRSKPAPDRMVVFDYSGPERLPLLAGPNKRMSGGNAFINAGYGLDAREMAKMLNHRRDQIINLD